MAERTAKDQVLEEVTPRSEVPFPIQEFRARHGKIRQAMRAAGIDMLYLSAPESMYYVSGYQAEWYQAQSPSAWPPMSGVALHVDYPDFILFDTIEELVMSRYTTVSKDTRIAPEELVPAMHRWVVQELRKDGWTPSKVGLEMGSYRPNRVVSQAFEKELRKEGCRVVDATFLIRSLRGTKSERELSCIREAGRIADVGLKAAASSMRAGMTELDVYGEVVSAMARAGGENPGITMPVVSGPKSACLHALASRKKIRRGEIVNIDVCGVFKRYHANMARTYLIGRPDRSVQAVVNSSAMAFDVLRDIIEPGLPVDRLVKRMREHYRSEGILDDAWWYGGYELGIAFPPDWVGSFVYDSETDSGGRRFEPGTVVNYESNFYLPCRAGASIIINTLMFGAKKAEILGRVSNELIQVNR